LLVVEATHRPKGFDIGLGTLPPEGVCACDARAL